MNRVLIESARNIPSPPHTFDVPHARAYLFAIGAKKYLIGKTHVIKDMNPIWQTEFEFAAIRCCYIEFLIKDKSKAGKESEICRVRLDLRSMHEAKSLEAKMKLLRNQFVEADPVISFRFNPFISLIPKRFAQSRIDVFYVYATFNPPISSEMPKEIPVEIKCLSSDNMDRNYLLLDKNSDWNYIGGSTRANLVHVDSGYTQVHRFHRYWTQETTNYFIIESNSYEGEVTLHVSAPKLEKESIKHPEYIRMRSKDDKDMIDVHTSKYVISRNQMILSSITISNKTSFLTKMKVKSIDSISNTENETFGDFEDRVIDQILGREYHKRYTNMNIRLPREINIIIGTTRYDQGEGDMNIDIEFVDSGNLRIDATNTVKKSEVWTSWRGSRFRDMKKYAINFEKIPDNIEFMTISAHTRNFMYPTNAEIMYLRVEDSIKNEEMAFILLDSKEPRNKAAYIGIFSLKSPQSVFKENKIFIQNKRLNDIIVTKQITKNQDNDFEFVE